MKNKLLIKRENVQELFARIKNNYINKYYNIFMKLFKVDGLEPIEQDYLFRKFWAEGTVSAFPIKHTGKVGLTLYSTQQFNMYDFPEVVVLINKWNVPFMPITPQVVNKDVVLGWIQPNHKPIKDIVNLYAERLAQVDMVINTQLNVHKLPFIVAATPENQERLKDIVDRILNNELAVFTDIEDVNLIQSIATTTPYIIDKLNDYKNQLETELMTFFGLNNMVSSLRAQYTNEDQQNANNGSISLSQEIMLDQIQQFFDKIQECFGIILTVNTRVEEQEFNDMFEYGRESEEEDEHTDNN